MAPEASSSSSHRSVDVLVSKLRRRSVQLSHHREPDCKRCRQAGCRLTRGCVRNSQSTPSGYIQSQVLRHRPISQPHTLGWEEISRCSAERCAQKVLFRILSTELCVFLLEHTVGNTVRKILHHIREEYHTATRGTATAASSSKGVFSIANFVLQGQPRKQTVAQKSEVMTSIRENDSSDPDSFAKALKPVLMEAIQDVLDELETVYDHVSKNAKDHIHSE